MFPVYFRGKKYYEKDCNSIFLSFYSCREALGFGSGVYWTEGLLIYPDGSSRQE